MKPVAIAVLLASGLTVVVAGGSPLDPSPAAARFSTVSAGNGAGKVAANLPAPDPPVITSSGPSGAVCYANVTWTAPPAGAALWIVRTIDAQPTTVAGPVASAGILSDSVPLASLTGPLSYALHEESLGDPGWFADSGSAVVTNC